jgi:uracil-DNA glycosylase family 4
MRPFVGPAGGVLEQLLAAIKPPILRSECYITNATRFRPPFHAPEDWWQDRLRIGRGQLAEEVAAAGDGPRAVLLLGWRALQCWTSGYLHGGIFDWRGSAWRQSDLSDVIPRNLQFPGNPLIIPTLHPAFLLRGQWHLWPVVVRDFWRAFRAPVPPRPLVLPPRVTGLPPALDGEEVAFDLETDGKDGITLAGMMAQGMIWQRSWADGVVEPLSELLAGPKRALVGHNLVNFDLEVLRKAGIGHTGPYHDTMTLACVLNPDLTAPREKDKEEGGRQTLAGLDGVSSISVNQYIQWKGMLGDAVVRRIVRRALGQAVEFDLSPWDTLKLYNAIDCWMTHLAYNGMRDQLSPERWKLFIEEQVACVPHRLSMRERGMRLDVSGAAKVRCLYERKVSRYDRYVQRCAAVARAEELESAMTTLADLPKCMEHKGFSRICPGCAATVPHRKERSIAKEAVKHWSEEFNSASTQEWEWLLIKVRKLAKYWGKRDMTAGGHRSMASDTLLSVQRRLKAAGRDEPLIRARLRVVRLQKRLGTYLAFAPGEDRINPVYNDCRTTSGRWSGGGSFEETA